MPIMDEVAELAIKIGWRNYTGTPLGLMVDRLYIDCNAVIGYGRVLFFVWKTSCPP